MAVSVNVQRRRVKTSASSLLTRAGMVCIRICISFFRSTTLSIHSSSFTFPCHLLTGHCTVYICGNRGANPRHATLLAKDVPPSQVIRVIDRFLMYYIRTADKLMRTARWLENMEGGIEASQDTYTLPTTLANYFL